MIILWNGLLFSRVLGVLSFGFFLFGRVDSMCLKQDVTYWYEGCDANFILSYTILEPIGMKVVALNLF